MGARLKGRLKRHQNLKKYIRENPFATDRDLAQQLQVSVPTIRLDRQILGIPEVRVRVKHVARDALQEPTALGSHEVVGELVDLDLNHSALSVLTVTENMVFDKTKIARGHHLYAQANSLAIAAIGAEVVLTGSARLRYKRPVYAGEKVVAKAMVKTQRSGTYLVSVHSKVDMEIVFKAQIVLMVLNHKANKIPPKITED